MSTKAMKIQKARFRKTGEWRYRTDLNTHTHTHTGAVRDYGKEQASTPLCPAGSSEKNEGKMRQKEDGLTEKGRQGSCLRHLNTPNGTKTKRGRGSRVTLYGCVWRCGSVSLFFSPSAFVTPEVPRGQERILFLSRALFSYTRSPSFFYTLAPRPLPLF